MSSFDRQDTQDKIVEIIAQELKLDPSTIKPETTFEELGADSLDVMQIILKIEDQFGLEIDDAHAENMISLKDVVEYVNAHRSK